MCRKTLGCLMVLAVVVAIPMAQARDPEARSSWLAAVEDEAKAIEAAGAPAGDGPPLPLHTLEGVGGALTVPMAYLVNPGPKGTIIGKPAVSVSYISTNRKKNLLVFAITETLFGRVELGYCLNRFDLGTFGHAVSKLTPLKINTREVYLHHFNVRGLVLPENSFGLPLPAVVIGAQFKYNGDIESIDDDARGTLTGVGLDSQCGVDYVLTASKMFPSLLCGRPVIFTVGVRNSRASNIGYTGFAESCETTLEGDVACLITDRIAVGYEFRQKNNPYDKIPRLLGDEDNWHAIRAAYIINDRMTIAAAWGCLGPVGNVVVNGAWGIQLKYEF